ncbi:MAG TPA: EamA family transporter [Acetobacteraceae bacterium]|nr:EamA family transporter [Acetobacteraceae bacterium]
MSWLIFAFAAPVLWAASTHIDKYLVDRYFHRGSVAVLLVFTAATGLVVAPVVWLLQPGSFTLPLRNIVLIVGAGVLSMEALLLYLDALQTETASSVVPWFQTAPLFGYALGYLLLGETLSPRQIAGGAAIMAGTVLLSLGGAASGERFKLRLAGLMLASAFMLGLSTAVFKLFAIENEFWATMAWTGVGQVIFGLGLLARAANRHRLRVILGGNTGVVITVNAMNEAINLAGSLAQRYALLLAPLSLIQAVGGTGPLFVFLFGVALSFVRPVLGSEDLSPANLVRKAGAAILVAIGVIAVSG